MTSGKPTVKQRKYVQGLVAGKSKKRAAIDAGYAESVGHNAKQKLDAKPGVQKLFTHLLAEAGATDELLAQRIFEGLNAWETKFATFEGEITDSDEVISFSERREMAELVLKLKGYLIEKHELRMVKTLEEILEASNE